MSKKEIERLQIQLLETQNKLAELQLKKELEPELAKSKKALETEVWEKEIREKYVMECDLSRFDDRIAECQQALINEPNKTTYYIEVIRQLKKWKFSNTPYTWSPGTKPFFCPF